jgi:hypothetical protein
MIIPVDEQDYASEAEELTDLLADNRLSELADLDDDISACICIVSHRCRKLSVVETLAMIENSTWSARGAEALVRLAPTL